MWERLAVASGAVWGCSAGLLEVCGDAFGSSWAHLGVGAVASLASWWAGAIFYWFCVVLGSQRRVFWSKINRKRGADEDEKSDELGNEFLHDFEVVFGMKI